MLTGKQQRIYRSIVAAAWRTYACEAELDVSDSITKDTWYRDELLVSPLHIQSSRQIDSEEEFDTICLHFALVSKDATQIRYWSAAADRRALYVLKLLCRRLRLTDEYVASIAKQMGFTVSIYDLPAQDIHKLVAALDTHRRRHLAA